MKHHINSITRTTGASVVLLMFLMTTSCVSKTEFLSSSVVPAARGYVKVKKDSNENYRIRVHTDYLAEASRLQPPRQTYVIWMDTDRNMARNIGQITSGSKLLSSNLKADFETVSSSKPVRIFITAEDDGTVSYPGSQVVLTTDRLK